MSGGRACRCHVDATEPGQPARLAPIGETEEKRRSFWIVLQRRQNHSAFNGYHYTPSAWSSIFCTRCRANWRTKARYVIDLPDAPEGAL